MEEVGVDYRNSNAMIVSVGYNIISCSTEAEFEKTMKELLSLDSAEVWISDKGEPEEYPCIGLLINAEGASLNFFGDDGSCYSSYRDGAEKKIVLFCDGQYELDAGQVIGKEEVLPVLTDFFRNKERSGSIEWDQLY